MPDEPIFQFQAGDAACEFCAGMDGQVSQSEIDLPHEGCRCQVVLVSREDDCPTYEADQVGTERYGPGGESARTIWEVVVTCCDGTEIGETLVIDHGLEPGGRTIDDLIEEWDSATDAAAQDLAAGCPPPEEFLCC